MVYAAAGSDTAPSTQEAMLSRGYQIHHLHLKPQLVGCSWRFGTKTAAQARPAAVTHAPSACHRPLPVRRGTAPRLSLVLLPSAIEAPGATSAGSCQLAADARNWCQHTAQHSHHSRANDSLSCHADQQPCAARHGTRSTPACAFVPCCVIFVHNQTVRPFLEMSAVAWGRRLAALQPTHRDSLSVIDAKAAHRARSVPDNYVLPATQECNYRVNQGVVDLCRPTQG